MIEFDRVEWYQLAGAVIMGAGVGVSVRLFAGQSDLFSVGVGVLVCWVVIMITEWRFIKSEGA